MENVNRKTKWNRAEGTDVAGNKVIQETVPHIPITSESVFGTPWANVAWIGVFTVSAVALIWRIQKKEAISLTVGIWLAALGVTVGISGMRVKDIIMPKAV